MRDHVNQKCFNVEKDFEQKLQKLQASVKEQKTLIIEELGQNQDNQEAMSKIEESLQTQKQQLAALELKLNK